MPFFPPTVATPFFDGAFGITNGSAVLESVNCTGNESTFNSLAFGCNHPGLGSVFSPQCFDPFTATAGVRCEQGKCSIQTGLEILGGENYFTLYCSSSWGEV